jgi:hypothetical protein
MRAVLEQLDRVVAATAGVVVEVVGRCARCIICMCIALLTHGMTCDRVAVVHGSVRRRLATVPM